MGILALAQVLVKQAGARTVEEWMEELLSGGPEDHGLPSLRQRLVERLLTRKVHAHATVYSCPCSSVALLLAAVIASCCRCCGCCR